MLVPPSGGALNLESLAREQNRRRPRAVWGRGGVAMCLYPPDHPSADVEIALGIAGLLAWLGLFFLPLKMFSWFLTPCAFHQITGWPCVSCGLTRGVLVLAEGRIGEALRMNPLGLGLLFFLLLYAPIACGLWLFRGPRLRIELRSRGARWMTLVVFVGLALANWGFLIWDGR